VRLIPKVLLPVPDYLLFPHRLQSINASCWSSNTRIDIPG